MFSLSSTSLSLHTSLVVVLRVPFSQTFMDYIDAAAARCGYTNYSAEYATYPPKGLLPLPGNSTTAVEGCSLWNEIFDAALVVNPAFNVYRIFDTVSPPETVPIERIAETLFA